MILSSVVLCLVPHPSSLVLKYTKFDSLLVTLQFLSSSATVSILRPVCLDMSNLASIYSLLHATDKPNSSMKRDCVHQRWNTI